MKKSYGAKGLVGFSVGGLFCAVDIERVEEIVIPLEISPLTSPNDIILGIADYRQSVVPVIDACHVFAGGKWSPQRSSKWIVARGAGVLVALAVDVVERVFSMGETVDAGEYPVAHGADLVAGVARIEGHLALLLDLDRLIRGHVSLPKSKNRGESVELNEPKGITDGRR